MEMQIQTIEPPIPPNDQNNGRKSQKVTLADGTICFANASMTLQPGMTYPNLELNSDNFGNRWLNWAKGNGGAPSQPEPPPPVPTPTPPQPVPAPSAVKVPKDPTPANIWIQGITQQAVASGVHDPAAVYQWAVNNYENFRDRKPVTAFPRRKPGGEAPF